jgi:glycosyltransferase involved in cell wall biosynthesis
MTDIAKYKGSVPLEEISREISTIDAGIIPNRKSPFTELNMPVRIFEYLSLHKPVIVPRTQGIRDYFDEDSIFFFEAGDAQSLAKVILEIYSDPARRRRVTEQGVTIYARYRWELQSRSLVELVSGLAGS